MWEKKCFRWWKSLDPCNLLIEETEQTSAFAGGDLTKVGGNDKRTETTWQTTENTTNDEHGSVNRATDQNSASNKTSIVDDNGQSTTQSSLDSTTNSTTDQTTNTEGGDGKTPKYSAFNTHGGILQKSQNYHRAVSMGKQSGKAGLTVWALPVGQLWVISPGTLGEPIVQPLEKAPIPAIRPQYTMYFGKFKSRESIIIWK